MPTKHRVLVINPGSTSTKIGVFENEYCLYEKIIRHTIEDLSPYNRVMEQYEYRQKVVLEELKREGINISKFDAICGRGGLLRPISGGTYQVNELMLQDLKMGFNGDHASNLGGIIAYGIASGLNIPAYIVDPVVVDELSSIARVTGMPEIQRKSVFHALNQKSVARQASAEIGKAYDSSNLVIVHMGGGISIGAHKKGQVIDVNNALDGEGPFSPERAGTIPAGDLVAMCYSGDYSREQMMNKLNGEGGLKAHLNTNDVYDLETRIQTGDHAVIDIYHAMAYQIGKYIGAMSTALKGQVDGIVLTGRLAYGETLVTLISNQVDWIADVLVYPGENELKALVEGTLRVLRKEEEPKRYTGGDVL